MNSIILEEFRLESDIVISSLKIAYEIFGNQEITISSKIIWAFHAFSANANVVDWWPGLFGENTLYSPADFTIICVNTIGSPYGSSRPENLDFPAFTVRDIVNSQLELAKHLEIQSIHTIIGGSFGGAQALEFSLMFSGNIDHMILLSCAAMESAWSIATHEAQRLALQADSTFGVKGGGASGLKAARAFAMLSYRTKNSIIKSQQENTSITDGFKASSYINYQGEKFIKRFDALSYYYLSKCLDTHNIGRNRGEIQAVLNGISIKTLVLSMNSDILIHPEFQKFIADNIPNSQYDIIETLYGHDGFLIETSKITERIEMFYKS